MQAHLTSATATTTSHSRRENGPSTVGHAGLNMTLATASARAKREDTTMIDVASAASANQYGSHAWEGLLRTTSAQEARHLVPIGRTCVPYPLYSEARDPNTLPDEHLLFARVVAEDDVPAATPSDALLGSNKGTMNSSHKFLQERTAAQAHVREALAVDPRASQKTTLVELFKRDADDDGDEFGAAAAAAAAGTFHADATNTMQSASYYESQLRRFAPYVQERLGHFLQPRTYLQVEGQPPPYATAEDEARLREMDDEAAAAGRPSSAPPVMFFPPPPQTQFWDAATPVSSRVQSRHGGNATVGGGDTNSSSRRGDMQATGRVGETSDGASAAAPRGGSLDATRNHPLDHSTTDGEQTHEAQTQPPSPLHPMQVRAATPSRAADVSDVAIPMPHSGPAMELSTRALFFQTCPCELQQGSATLRNTGTTTIYYSLTVVDVVQEHLREMHEALHGPIEGGDELARTVTDTRDGGRPLPQRAPKSALTADSLLLYPSLRLTHQLAAHQRRARDEFFFLSAPMNGVVLPGEECVFAFSVRATREGLFQSTYELLTVPPAPERIFLRLRALVRRDGPSLQWLAQPVAAALTAKVAVDAQRRLVQRIGANSRAITAAELRQQITELDDADDVARQAERETRATQEAAWNRANRLTFDHVPYSAAVYDKLEQLSRVVRETFARLNGPAEEGESAERGNSSTATAGAATGSTATNAVADASKIRDTVAAPTAETPQKQRLVPPPNATTSPATTSAANNVLSPVPHNPQQQQQQPQPTQRSSSVTPSSTTMQWDGALLPLLYQIMSIRDSATRQVFLEAMQVLLRAARASRCPHLLPVSHTRSGVAGAAGTASEEEGSRGDAAGDVDGDDGDDEEGMHNVPLSVLLRRAAAALADVVVARQRPTAERQCDEALLQPTRPSAALTLTTQGDAAGVAGAGGGAAAAGGGAKNRTTSAATNAAAGGGGGGGPQKKSMAAPRSGRGTTSSIPETKAGAAAPVATADGAEATPAQRLLLSCVAPEELQGFSVTQTSAEAMTLLRAAEERAAKARLESELREAKAALTEMHTTLFNEVIDAACDRGPLATCTAERLAELRAVQQSPLMAVDVSADPLVAPPPGKPGKRK